MNKTSHSKLLSLVQRRRETRSANKRRTCPFEASYQGVKRSGEPTLKLRLFSPEHLKELTLNSPDELSSQLASTPASWLHCTGLHNSDLIHQIGELTNIPPLIREDILHTSTHPRVDITDDYVFAHLRLVSREDHALDSDNIDLQSCSFFLTKDYLLSFSEAPTVTFDIIKERLQSPQARPRFVSLDYLFWALLDAITHQNLSTISTLHDQLFLLDQELVKDIASTTSVSLYNLQREASVIQRLTRPNRDITSALLHQTSPLLSEQITPFLQDLRDYSITTSEEAESLREFAAASREYLLSESNQRLNNVMKILTVISTIFLPLSFLAAVYGMNFRHMPELSQPIAYPLFWLTSLLLSGLSLLFFRKKKWL